MTVEKQWQFPHMTNYLTVGMNKEQSLCTLLLQGTVTLLDNMSVEIKYGGKTLRFSSCLTCQAPDDVHATSAWMVMSCTVMEVLISVWGWNHTGWLASWSEAVSATVHTLHLVDNLTSLKVVCHQSVAGDVTLRDLMDAEGLLWYSILYFLGNVSDHTFITTIPFIDFTIFDPLNDFRFTTFIIYCILRKIPPPHLLRSLFILRVFHTDIQKENEAIKVW